MTVVDRIRERAARSPEHPALVLDRGGAQGSELHTYASLVSGFERAARRYAEVGVGPGSRCGLVAPQGAGFIQRALGILAAGGCLVPIPDDHRGSILDTFSSRARLHHLVIEEKDEEILRTLPPPASLSGDGDREFRALKPAYLRFTSGTTSERKGVILSHASIEARLAAANRALGIGPADRVMWLLPMAHHFVVSILLYLSEGATVLLPSSSLARPILEFADREAATVFYASPYHYRVLGKDSSSLGLGNVRLAISTAEGLHPDVAVTFAKRFGVPIAQALGIIEVGLPVINLESRGAKPGSLGRPLPDFDIWLRGEDGRPIEGGTSADRTGEICIRGPGMLDAYLDPWLPAARILEPDGFRTGDQGFFDAEGDLHLAGRRTSRISMAGMKFFGEEVEAVLSAHPAVRESRVFAREHPHLGEIPVAEIVCEDATSPPEKRELIAHCRGSLPGYKVPREFRVVAALARTATGKLLRTPPSPPA